jgi:hypothetical protein
MFGGNLLFTRIAIGKAIGFVIGLIGFLLLPRYMPDADLMFRFGLLFWYTTMGAIIGVFGVVTWHPVLHLPMPWWFRAPLIGGWLNFVLALFMYDTLAIIMNNFSGPDGAFQSPFWIVAEGISVGLIMGFACTKFAGEGKEIVGT